jgi:hypothetical protein
MKKFMLQLLKEAKKLSLYGMLSWQTVAEALGTVEKNPKKRMVLSRLYRLIDILWLKMKIHNEHLFMDLGNKMLLVRGENKYISRTEVKVVMIAIIDAAPLFEKGDLKGCMSVRRVSSVRGGVI